jgi:hypothetical protein
VAGEAAEARATAHDRRVSGQAPPPAGRPGRGRYTWFLGVVAFLLLTLVTLNSITSRGVQSGGPDSGGKLLPFAVPLAAAAPRKDDDANVDRDHVCTVRGRGILNICELSERGPVVLALFPTEGGRCRSVLAQLQRIAPRFPRVEFAAVGIAGDRTDLGGQWSFPVGSDKDRAVASIYGLVGCPQVTFAQRGGNVIETTRRELSDGELAGLVRRLT